MTILWGKYLISASTGLKVGLPMRNFSQVLGQKGFTKIYTCWRENQNSILLCCQSYPSLISVHLLLRQRKSLLFLFSHLTSLRCFLSCFSWLLLLCFWNASSQPYPFYPTSTDNWLSDGLLVCVPPLTSLTQYNFLQLHRNNTDSSCTCLICDNSSVIELKDYY